MTLKLNVCATNNMTIVDAMKLTSFILYLLTY